MTETTKKSVFPLIKRFKDVKDLPSTVILNEEIGVHGKTFRAGTIMTVLGWKDIHGTPYLVLCKGAWEGMVEYSWIQPKISPCK